VIHSPRAKGSTYKGTLLDTSLPHSLVAYLCPLLFVLEGLNFMSFLLYTKCGSIHINLNPFLFVKRWSKYYEKVVVKPLSLASGNNQSERFNCYDTDTLTFFNKTRKICVMCNNIFSGIYRMTMHLL